jgi:large subunit ribosomal protein L24
MANKVHVKQGDTVFVLVGKDKHRRGKVLSVVPGKDRVIVEGVNKVKKHKKAQQMNPGGIMTQEAAIHASNVMLICEKCKAPTRVARRVLESGEKVRACKKCGEVIDTIVVKKEKDKGKGQGKG